jgi:hypothetical protein
VRSFHRAAQHILFKGSATVTNGRFSVNFVAPKDINYAFGFGKISYYAENGTPLDAAGADSESRDRRHGQFTINDDTPPHDPGVFEYTTISLLAALPIKIRKSWCNASTITA